MTALYTNNIQKPAKWPDFLLSEVTQPSESELSDTTGCLVHGDHLKLFPRQARPKKTSKVVVFFSNQRSVSK